MIATTYEEIVENDKDIFDKDISSNKISKTNNTINFYDTYTANDNNLVFNDDINNIFYESMSTIVEDSTQCNHDYSSMENNNAFMSNKEEIIEISW